MGVGEGDDDAFAATSDGSIARVFAIILFVLTSMIAIGGAVGWVATAAGFDFARAAIVGVLFALALLATAIARRGRDSRIVFEVLVLVVLMGWGMAINHGLPGSCTRHQCDDDWRRFLSEPEVYGLAVLHLANVVAYAISRRRPEALRPWAEAFVAASLLLGVVLQITLLVQFGIGAIIVGAVLSPIGMPALAPFFAIGLYAFELVTRLRRRGRESVTVDRPPPTLAWPVLGRAVLVSPLVIGAHSVIMAVVLRDPLTAVHVFTRTCDHALSTVPLVVQPGYCHYLCTVAARGHASLVRPERLGRRNGAVIVVNRQLAIANAFEDLLHERWPRFGALARRIYDRLGYPISRFIRTPLAADAIYLAMKPAEWLFYLVLLLLDPRAPEARIDRMYR